jgi:hypothetical protein
MTLTEKINVEEAARIKNFTGAAFEVGDAMLTITSEGIEYVLGGTLLHIYKHEELTAALNFFRSCGETVTPV